MLKPSFQEEINRAIDLLPLGACKDLNQIFSTPRLEVEHRKIVLERLTKDKSEYHHGPDRVHIGVAGFFNLEIAAVTRPDYILCLDCNTAQPQFWKEVVSALKDNDSIAGFRKNCGLVNGYYANWLREPDAYAHLHKLAKEGRIATGTIDIIGGMDRAEAIGATLKRLSLKTDTAYWSNIGAYLLPNREEAFVSIEDNVSGNEPLEYSDGTKIPPMRYSNDIFAGEKRDDAALIWDGKEFKHGNKLIPFEKLPPLEKMLRNISAIGGKTGCHIMTDLMADGRPLIITDGPPRNLMRIAQLRGEVQSVGK